MNRNELVDQCKRLIAEAYQEATEMIVAYLETHPGEERKPLCREIDPENFQALDKRVSRLQERRRSDASSPETGTLAESRKREERRVRHAIRENPELVAEIVASDPDLTRKVNQEQARLHSSPDRLPRSRPEVDYDRQYQDAAAEIVRGEASRRTGTWTPSDLTEAHRHFLIQALTDPGSVDADRLVDEISAYLQEVAS